VSELANVYIGLSKMHPGVRVGGLLFDSPQSGYAYNGLAHMHPLQMPETYKLAVKTGLNHYEEIQGYLGLLDPSRSTPLPNDRVLHVIISTLLLVMTGATATIATTGRLNWSTRRRH
jgi:hypothetical protein